jgi:hypothetical protein
MSKLRFGRLFAFFTISWLTLYPFPLLAQEESLFVPLPIQQGKSPDFAVYESVPVFFKTAGMTGFLQILQDKRVTPDYRETWGTSADPGFALGYDDPFVESLKGHPLENGRIRLIDRHGRVIAVDSFDEPLARIKTVYLYGTKFPSYLVSVDYGNGMGSYAGPATTLMEVRGGRLIDIPIDLTQSLKNDWQFVPAANGKGKEIEVIQCRPNFKNPNAAKTDEFVVDYSTYRFVDGQWRGHTLEKIGFWEGDENFPPRSAFP